MSLNNLSATNIPSALIDAGVFEQNKRIVSNNQILYYTDPSSSVKVGYVWKGSLPHVTSTSNPNTDGGISETTWVGVIYSSLYEKMSDEGLTLNWNAHLPSVEVAYGLEKKSLKMWSPGQVANSEQYWLYSDGTVWNGIGPLLDSPIISGFTKITPSFGNGKSKTYIATATEGQITFNIPYTFNDITVFVNGNLQIPNVNYTIDGTAIIFTTGLNLDDSVYVFLNSNNLIADDHTNRIYSSIASEGQKTLQIPYDFSTAIVYINGILQNPTNAYMIGADRIITFSDSLYENDEIIIILGDILVPNDEYLLKTDLSKNSALGDIGYVKSIIELRSINPVNDNQLIYVDVNDIKTRVTYRYDRYDTTSVDDGVLVVVSSNGSRWKRTSTTYYSIIDYGFSYNPASVQNLSTAYSSLNSYGHVYSGLTNEKFPGRGIKTWRETQGTLENATILSVRNADSATTDPTIPVLAVDNFSTRASYSNRDHVGMYLGMDSKAPIVTTTNTTFTNTSVISDDFLSTIRSTRLKVGVLIDTMDSPKKTGKVISISGNTLTVDGWVVAGGGGSVSTPANGTGVKVNPMGGLWCANWILGLSAEHDVSTAAYIMEGDIRNNKSAGSGHGMYMRCADSSFSCGNAFWAVGGSTAKWSVGLATQYCSTGVYTDGTTDVAFWSNNSPTAIRIRGATTALVIGTATTTYTTVDGLGTISGLRLKPTVFAASSTIDALSVICSSDVVTAITTINLPEPTAARELGRILILKNPLSSTANVFFAGGVENSSGSIILRPGESSTVYCNGTRWVVISDTKQPEMLSGNGTSSATSVTVNHTLGAIPSSVQITLTASFAGNFWVSDKTSTSFNVNFSSTPTSLTFDWLIRR